ncbi:hypothetical protein SCHPADRAFT_348746 [Schizopora paradoxa]|uniref:F-box domain-containing protein n=1 Tax=Schizopora paradoxa TaxID=27342 RepID=A0A0H2RNY8_9AGAM|nr:hypothetical protein SCHPADRAFT_348746 [Schizopora paradoxa]
MGLLPPSAMSAVQFLPVEILRTIFLLVMQNSRYCNPVFKTGDTFLDCVVLIDLTRVCRRWREIALADPTLWMTLHVSLRDPPILRLLQVADFVSACLERSENLPLTCYISISITGLLETAIPLLESGRDRTGMNSGECIQN